LPFPWAAAAANALFKGLIWEDFMSIRTVPAILAAAMFAALGSPLADAQQKTQPPQSLRLYVLDCGIITPPNVGLWPQVERGS
jgi:hypothetical protein